METERKIKFLAIIALVLAITAMTLGFAAFSTTLNISSSAMVTPSEQDFKMTIYGFENQADRLAFINGGYEFKEEYFSTSSAYGIPSSEGITASVASINNKESKIENISAVITKKDTSVVYPILIRNEGKYNAYYSIENYGKYDDIYTGQMTFGTCTADSGTSQKLVDEVCDKIGFGHLIVKKLDDIEINESEKYIKIPPNSYILFTFKIDTLEMEHMADGPFNITYPNVELNFTTQP